MPGRYNFQSRFGRPDDGWFTIASTPVSTSLAVVGLGAIGIVLSFVPGLTAALELDPSVFRGLEVWRLFTYVVPNPPDIWTLILLYLVYAFGSQLERQLGREPMLRLVIALTVVPAFVFGLLSLFANSGGAFYGLRFVELGLLVAFAAQFPWVRFFFGIPAPVMVGIFALIDILRALDSLPQLGMVVTTIALALLGIRAMGHASDVHQIPRLSIPGLTPASGAGRGSSRKVGRSSSSSRRNKAPSTESSLRVVPPTPSSTSSADNPPPEIDALLEQINASGIDSLSPEQRRTLDDYAKRLRDKRDR